jgi:hypothetical protein
VTFVLAIILGFVDDVHGCPYLPWRIHGNANLSDGFDMGPSKHNRKVLTCQGTAALE